MKTQVYPPHLALAPFGKYYLVSPFTFPQAMHCVFSCKVSAGIQFAFKVPAVTSFHYYGTSIEDRYSPCYMEAIAQFDYTDQSHLITDFHQYTSNSPLLHFKNTPFIYQNVHKHF